MIDLLAEVRDFIANRWGVLPATVEMSEVTGGDIHQSFHVRLPNDSAFVKINALNYEGVLRSEYQSLCRLNDLGMTHYPQPILFEVLSHGCCFMMSYHNIQAINVSSAQALGRALALQHQITAGRFGWPDHNYIGLTPQYNHQHDDWSEFYREQRLLPQLQRATKNGLDKQMAMQIDVLIRDLDSVFEGIEITPVLLHGDLWSGNVAFDENIQAALLYDPAPYYGHYEVDLAMARLFNGFPDSFYESYFHCRSIHCSESLHDDFERRQRLYHLYHALNHFNLFGSAYESLVAKQL